MRVKSTDWRNGEHGGAMEGTLRSNTHEYNRRHHSFDGFFVMPSTRHSRDGDGQQSRSAPFCPSRFMGSRVAVTTLGKVSSTAVPRYRCLHSMMMSEGF
jgi:hypothetical protein